MTQDFSELPPSLPIPVDDGESDRFLGKNVTRTERYLYISPNAGS
jgi:hypothetical protein